MPYITASIIVQLLTASSPRGEDVRKEAIPQAKITQYTVIVAIALAILQATSNRGARSQRRGAARAQP